MLHRPVVRILAAAAVFTLPVLCQSTDPKANDGQGNGPPAWVLSKGQKDGLPTKEEKKQAATERSLSGFVTDADGKPIEGAVVQLKDTRTLQVRSFITRSKGDYYFSGLSKDIDYELKAQAHGKTSSSKTLSSFDSKQAPVINLQVK
ncbi:MAG TPA: carboxypeptidase-like regulatory domain-containing protein [Bryobacteraceae bacterium]|nr:carboxypeptidase-like regulatory domain-containing protein [Bryobacteraceae bacterium]